MNPHEAVETPSNRAQWGYKVKGIPRATPKSSSAPATFTAHITIVASRQTISIATASPLRAGFKIIPYGESIPGHASRQHCAFLVEPIQGEAASRFLRRIPSPGRESAARIASCSWRRNPVRPGRTGKSSLHARRHHADVLIVGKASPAASIRVTSSLARNSRRLQVRRHGKHLRRQSLGCAIARTPCAS